MRYSISDGTQVKIHCLNISRIQTIIKIRPSFAFPHNNTTALVLEDRPPWAFSPFSWTELTTFKTRMVSVGACVHVDSFVAISSDYRRFVVLLMLFILSCAGKSDPYVTFYLEQVSHDQIRIFLTLLVRIHADDTKRRSFVGLLFY